MTLSEHFAAFRTFKRDTVIDWARFETAWKHYKGLHAIAPKSWTSAVTDAETKRLTKRYAPGTLANDLGKLSVFGMWLVRQGHLTAIPYWTMPQPAPPKERYLTAAEMKAILSSSTGWFAAETRLLMLTGQRIQAVLSLRPEQIKADHIDFNVGIVRRAKRRGVVWLTPEIREALAMRSAVRPSYTRYLAEWHRVCEKAGVAGATPHAVRHGTASVLVAKGVPMLEVSRLLGHSNSKITERVYAKFAPDYTARAVGVMGDVLR